LRTSFVALYGFEYPRGCLSPCLDVLLCWLDLCSGPWCKGECVFLRPECRSVLYLGCRRCCAPLRPELVSLIKKNKERQKWDHLLPRLSPSPSSQGGPLFMSRTANQRGDRSSHHIENCPPAPSPHPNFFHLANYLYSPDPPILISILS
jgi:hypothetical protein